MRKGSPLPLPIQYTYEEPGRPTCILAQPEGKAAFADLDALPMPVKLLKKVSMVS